MKKYTFKNSERGLGLFGMMLAFLITVLALAGIIGMYTKVTNHFNTVSLLATITQVKARIDSTYGLEGSFSDDLDLVPSLNAMKAWPSGVLVGKKPKHDWGGAIEVIGAPGGETTQFRFKLDDLPDEQCIDLSQKFAVGTSNAGAIAGLFINKTTISSPYSIANISVACTNDDSNTVNLDFNL